MGAVGCFCVAASLFKINGQYKCTDTGADMYYISSCKSTEPIAARNPPSPQTMCAIG